MKLTDPLAIAFINSFQGGIPICQDPYSQVATQLGIDEASLLSLIKLLLEEGWLSRFGPLYDAKKMGGGLTLAALSVAESEFEKVTACVNGFEEVAHNYRRSHALNMWFVVATETEQGVQRVLDEIQTQTGLQVYNCPKQQEFYVGLKLYIDETGKVDSVPMDEAWLVQPASTDNQVAPNELQRKIITATQAGLPLTARPYQQIAEQVHSDADSVMRELQSMINRGSLRRIGAVPNHYKLGLRGNGMTVWDVPDELVTEIGTRVGAMDFVSHCYQRPRHLPNWPYNLFAMVHGSDKDQASKKLEVMIEALSPYNFRHDVLFSTAILKKSGLRLLA